MQRINLKIGRFKFLPPPDEHQTPWSWLPLALMTLVVGVCLIWFCLRSSRLRASPEFVLDQRTANVPAWR
jgi:Na+/melibiose symporter-like transporter